MGKLEIENRKKIRRTKIQEAVLITLASGGRLGAKAITDLISEQFLNTRSPFAPRKIEIVTSTANRLYKKGLLKLVDKHYELAPHGRKIVETWQREDFKLKKPKIWDKKWRIIIFDIPENKRYTRNKIREIFKSAGFYKLQNSVWVYPYDCEDVIGLLKTDYGIGKDLLYIIADEIENDKYLRMEFDLVYE